MLYKWCLFVLALQSCFSAVVAFQPTSSSATTTVFPTTATSKRREKRLTLSAIDTKGEKTTLTEATTWKMRLVLNNKLPRKSKDEIFSLNGFFQEEEGYEPPQGVFRGKNDDTEAPVQVLKSRWMLSEDPNDRKDSLWIWGLFSEPLYPFLLLRISLAEKAEDGTMTPWPPLYAQISHRRKDGSVRLEPADVTVRNLEQLNADPFGAAKVEVYEEDVVGRISFQAIS